MSNLTKKRVIVSIVQDENGEVSTNTTDTDCSGPKSRGEESKVIASKNVLTDITIVKKPTNIEYRTRNLER